MTNQILDFYWNANKDNCINVLNYELQGSASAEDNTWHNNACPSASVTMTESEDVYEVFFPSCAYDKDMTSLDAITIGDAVSFIPTSDVRWIDPTFEPTECLIHRNQADRIAVYVAVSSKSILVRYQMPNGKVFHNRLFPNNTYKAVKLSF